MESVGELPGLESGPERGGIGSVTELATIKQEYKKVDHFTTRLVGVLQKFSQFQPKSLSQNNFSLFVPGYKVLLQLLPFEFFVVPSFCSLMPNVQVLSFWSELFKRLLGETHVFGRTFIFCIFLCNGGAFKTFRHVVDLSVSLTMSVPAQTT